MAVIALKQGFGRLIRTGSDKGVLCILDTRIIQKSYGAVFRKSLHESPLTRDITEIDAFFDRWESRISPKPVSSKAEKKNALGRVRSTKRRAAP
jgi:hypothetical protein